MTSPPCPNCGGPKAHARNATCRACWSVIGAWRNSSNTADLSLEGLLKRTELTPNGCMEWQGRRLTGHGYGQVGAGNRLYVHRLVCELTHGPAPEGKPYATHSCDNPPCVNPAHLVWGSPSENLREAYARGRRPRSFVERIRAGASA